MKSRKKAFTLIEMMVAISVIGILAGVLLPVLSRARENARQMQCKNHLRQLATGMLQYVDQYGKGKYYSWPGQQRPRFYGRHWVASMYNTELVLTPEVYICPSSVDDNDKGGNLNYNSSGRFQRALVGEHDVSYMGRHGDNGVLVDSQMDGGTIMMTDDDNDPTNHDDGFNIVFFDGHVEYADKIVDETYRLQGRRRNRRVIVIPSSVLKN